MSSHPLRSRFSKLRSLRWCLCLISACLMASVSRPSRCEAEGAQSLKEAYKEVYLAAESLVNRGKLHDAIQLYVGSLEELKGDGRIHLRLAQLYQKTKTPSIEPLISYHYLRCLQDQKMDSFMRDTICQREVKSRFSPLLVAGNPRSLEVLSPHPFVGVTAPNTLLPNGPIKLRFQRRGSNQAEVLELRLPLQGPVNLGPRSFMPSRPKLTSRDLLGVQASASASPTQATSGPSSPSGDPFAATQPQPSFQRRIQLPRWPAYLLFALSVASAGAGVYTYLNIDDFSGNILGKELPVVLWGSAGAAAVVSGGWLAISW